MWPLKTIFYFGFFWFACLMALVNPIWGVVNYLMAYQTNPTNTWWGAPLTDLGMRFSMLAAVFTCLGFIFARKYVPVFKPAYSLWELGLLLIVTIAAITLLTGYGYTEDSQYAFEKLWKMALFVFIFGRLVTTRRNIQIVLWTLVIGSLYVGWDAYTAPRSAFWRGRLERIGGPDFATTSGTAAHLGAMLPLIGVAFLIARHRTGQILAAVTAAFAVNTIILCRTRSAFVGLACGAAVALLTTPKVKRFRIHLMLVAGAFAAYSLTDGHFWDRMNTLTNQDALAGDPAAMSRATIWRTSLEVLADYPHGVGPGNFPAVIGLYDQTIAKRSTHNTLITCFTELGVAGGLVFLAMIVGTLRLLWLSTKHAKETDDPNETKMLIYGSLVSLITYLVTGLGTERFYCESFWWVFILPLCLHRMVLQESQARVRAMASVPCDELEDEEEPWGSLQYEY